MCSQIKEGALLWARCICKADFVEKLEKKFLRHGPRRECNMHIDLQKHGVKMSKIFIYLVTVIRGGFL
jgi:hypothetical protein